MPKADFGKRALSWLIDWLAPGIVASTVGAIIGGSVGNFVAFLLVGGFVAWNSGYQAGTTGYSLGRKIAKTKLISEQTQQPLGAGQGVLRAMIQWALVSFTCIGGLLTWLWPLWDTNKQTLADKMVKSIVVDESGQPPVQQY